MYKITMVILLIMIIVIFSGCTEQITNKIGFGTTNIADISKNPENYYGKTLKLKGILGDSQISIYKERNGIDYGLTNEQGYSFPIKLISESGRSFDSGSDYVITGIVKFIENCICQNRYVCEDGTSSEWEDSSSYFKRIPEECGKNETLPSPTLCGGTLLKEIKVTQEWRCNPSSIEKIYYLEGTEPMVKIS
jgi:hypothetical protein